MKLYFWLIILWLGGVLCGSCLTYQFNKNQIRDLRIEGIEFMQKLIECQEERNAYSENFARHANCIRACTSEENKK